MLLDSWEASAGWTAVPDVAGHGGEMTLGVSVLEEFRAKVGRDDIARHLAGFGALAGYDASSRRLADVTGGHVDLAVEDHRVALIVWLRAWGCRHLRRTDTARTAEALRTWWEAWGARLPGQQAALTVLSEAELTVAGQAYEALRTAQAAGRNVKGREVHVTFGDTAAAKAMFAIRPRSFLPWDEPIRLAFGRPGGGDAYVKLLRLSAAALDGLAWRLAVPVSELPAILGRPESPPPKLVDEYLWIRITRGL
jgi:hypothetical protein